MLSLPRAVVALKHAGFRRGTRLRRLRGDSATNNIKHTAYAQRRWKKEAVVGTHARARKTRLRSWRGAASAARTRTVARLLVISRWTCDIYAYFISRAGWHLAPLKRTCGVCCALSSRGQNTTARGLPTPYAHGAHTSSLLPYDIVKNFVHTRFHVTARHRGILVCWNACRGLLRRPALVALYQQTILCWHFGGTQRIIVTIIFSTAPLVCTPLPRIFHRILRAPSLCFACAARIGCAGISGRHRHARLPSFVLLLRAAAGHRALCLLFPARPRAAFHIWRQNCTARAHRTRIG